MYRYPTSVAYFLLQFPLAPVGVPYAAPSIAGQGGESPKGSRQGRRERARRGWEAPSGAPALTEKRREPR